MSFAYKDRTQKKIFEFIQKQEYLNSTIDKLNLPEKPVKIVLPIRLAEKIEPYAKSLAIKQSDIHDLYGFRYQRQMQIFVKAIALLEDKMKVDEDCIEELDRLSEFINLGFNQI